MIFLNGIPPIMGLAFFHVIVLNIFAIVIEYGVIKKRHVIRFLLFRVISANLISLVVGVLAIWVVPEWLGGHPGRTEQPITIYDRFTLVVGLAVLFLANILIEFPVYIINKNGIRLTILFKTVVFANLLSNIPVFILYGLIVFS